VSFSVPPGEFFGIVGRNGSGKSTLLKCLAGIYRVDSGEIYVNGRMSTFIELGVGFNPDLPARDNAMLNATMLGLSPREARRRFDSVIDFAELGEFIDLKIKNYSSGMLVRLAFSVMIHVDAEILLIDEVLAVGDAAFQQKCFDEFERIRRSGATVLFVTHDMAAVQRFCDRALLLEHGRPVELGDPEHVGNRYLELNFSQEARAAEQVAAEAELENDDGIEARTAEPSGPAVTVTSPPEEDDDEAFSRGEAERRDGDGRAEIVEAWFENEQGKRAELLPTGQRCTFVARVHFNEDVEDPLFSVNVHNTHRDHLLSASNLWSDPRCGVFKAGEEIVYRVSFENVLAPDRYYVTPAVARHGGAWIDRRERLLSVVVTGTHGAEALLELPYEIAIERGVPARAASELAL
jgi:ABC-type polysaccharide/polyol phosphate transport system ATPase subunit